MKKYLFVLLLSGCCCSHVSAQQEEIEQLLLNVEKLMQLKQILSDMKEGYEVLSNGYNTIRDLSQGNFKLHELFLNGLLNVNPAVRNYFKIARIVSMQKQLLAASRKGFNGFQESGLFAADELSHFRFIMDRVVTQSIQNMSSLADILTAGKMRMSDAERLSAIDALFNEMTSQLEFVTAFNNSTGLLALQRLKEKKDVNEMKVLHGIK
jgi:hypothetical protein